MNSRLIVIITLAVAAFLCYRSVRLEKYMRGLPYSSPQYDFSDWTRKYIRQCESYNRSSPPLMVQDCPDSSFTFVSDLRAFVPNAEPIPGCIQLKDSPFCFSTSTGKYEADLYRISEVSA
jgi:hypothetical protein